MLSTTSFVFVSLQSSRAISESDRQEVQRRDGKVGAAASLVPLTFTRIISFLCLFSIPFNSFSSLNRDSSRYFFRCCPRAQLLDKHKTARVKFSLHGEHVRAKNLLFSTFFNVSSRVSLSIIFLSNWYHRDKRLII